ncbi:MAG: bile acid:sodium symporter family protein [Pontibacterium sp.]
MENSLMTQWILPAALFSIMLGVGMSLRVADFKRVLSSPGVVVMGVSMQLLLLPLLGFVVVNLLALPPALAIGLMILTFSPGGATSNMITYLARGDTALSVCMTATVSLIAPFTLPWLTLWALTHWQGEAQAINFPVYTTTLKLVVMTVVPVVLGVAIQHWHSAFCARLQKPVKMLSMVFLLLVVVGIAKANWVRLPELVMQLGPAVMLLIGLAFTVGFGLARKLRLDKTQSLTLAIEVGIQNAGTALLVTGMVLQNAEMSATALTYGILMNLPAFALIFYRNRFNVVPAS